MFAIINDVDLFNECAFLKYDINCLCLEFRANLMEQNVEFLQYTKK